MDPVTFSTLSLAVGASLAPLSQLGWPRRGYGALVAVVALVVVTGYIVYNLAVRPAAAPPPIPGLVFDSLGFFFGLVAGFVGLLTVLGSMDYLRGDPNEGIFYGLLLFSTLGMIFLGFSVDLLTIFIGWELMSIPTYAMAAFRKRDAASSEGAMKYFLIGALSSGILLYGISLAYLLAGSTALDRVAQALARMPAADLPLALLTMGLLVAGFGFKMAIVPFHIWIPDAYEGSPTTLSAFLSAATKKAGFVAAIRVLLVAFSLFPLLRVEWAATLALLAFITMTFGNLAALTQRSVTRLLAYSSISQAGYILIGLAVARPEYPLGLSASLFHILNHAILSGGGFLAAAGMSVALGRVDLDGMSGMGLRMPVISLGLAISLLSLAGMPLLNGFWSKLFLFAAAVEAGSIHWWGPYLALAGFLNSGLSLGYYGWLIKRMYMDEAPEGSKVAEPAYIAGTVLGLTILAILIGIYPTSLFNLAQSVAMEALAPHHPAR